jgi:hypothetical protein
VDREIVDVLKSLNISLSRLERGNFYNFMLAQRMAERSTPTNSKFGTAIVGSVGLNWVQILQRNERRKNINLLCSSTIGYLMVNNDNLTDANEAAQNFARSLTHLDLRLDNAMIIPLANINTNNPITIDTTGTLYVTSFTITDGAASVQQGVVTWQEAIYSDVDAIPGFMVDTTQHKPGEVSKLTAGTMPWLDEDESTEFARGGVR